ncbi:hypothetical protein JL720_6302 [Aureococcus anophagefferens]|nr:hypothetical protein JL720_6302 [Aureococcus anophagefferens]
MNDGRSLTEEAALEASGECQLELVTQLVLRQLSHNLLKSLHGFAELVSLEELNLNFNQLASLDGLERCVKICRLYASNNRLAKAEGLCGLPLLRTACLFGNQLSGLDGTLETLRRCPKLREVDLLGNPLAHERGYKHRVVRCLVRLEALDGDRVADDKLHADPVALGYLAKHMLDHPMQGPAYRDGDWRADDARKFVERLRLRSATHKDSLVTGGPAAKGCADVDGATRVASAVDASDPYLTIRRLIALALVESLQSDATRAPAAPAADVADIARELERLRVENANMFLIREENASLRKRVGEQNADAGELRRLKEENADLAARLGEAEAQLQALHLAAITGSGAAAPAPRPRTAAEIIDECAGEILCEIDDELEDLFRANAASLSQLRSDVEAFQFEVGVEPAVARQRRAVAPIALRSRDAAPGQTDREPDVDTPAHVRGRPLWSSPSGDADSAAAVASGAAAAVASAGVARARKARAAPAHSRPKTPSVADILAGRRTREAASESDDDESADVWNAALAKRKCDGAPAVSDRVVTTKHAWLLMGDDAADDGAEESKADVLTAL